MNFHLCWKAFSPRPLGTRLNLDLHFTRGAIPEIHAALLAAKDVRPWSVQRSLYKSPRFQNNFPKPILKLSLHLKGLLIDAFVAKVCGEVPHFHQLCLVQRRGDFILVSNDFMVTWLLTNWFIGINVSKSISTGLETHAFWHNKLANFFHWKTQ